MRHLVKSATCGALLAALSLCQLSFAQEVDDSTRASARRLGYAGVEAFEARDYKGASEKLERAFGVLQVPTLGLWSARALVKLGKLVEAQERYIKVGRLAVSGGDADVQRKAQAEAAEELAALEPRIPSLVIDLKGAEASEVALQIDDVKVATPLIGEPRPVNPGARSVLAVRGSEQRRLTVTVAEAQQQRVMIDFGAPAPPAAGPEAASNATLAVGSGPSSRSDAKPAGAARRTVGWVAVAVGGAGLIFGGVTGAMVLGKKGDLEANARCRDDACGPSQQGDVDSYNSLRTLSTVGFIAGGVVAATGVVLVLTAPKAQSPSAALWLGPSSASVRGTF